MRAGLRARGVAAAAAALGVAAPACLGLWPRAVLADMPNCAEYPSACANYEQNSAATPWIVIAGAIVLAAVLIVAAGLAIVLVRRRRRAGASPAAAPRPRVDRDPPR